MNSINPRAGDVPLPEDPREITAALRAGRVSYRIFPYLEWRYGERGRAFTRSDSAWLAWLSRHDPERVRQQIAWLRGILSNRGMPSMILEVHLDVLYRQLVRANPEKRRQYGTLKLSAQWLRREREASIPEETAKRLVVACVASVTASGCRVLTGATELLVAAIADQFSGVEHAIQSTESWLSDVESLRSLDALREHLSPAECRCLDSGAFAEQWPAALTATIAEAGIATSQA